MKNIFVIGSKGYDKKYGGWETFVKGLIDNYNDINVCFHVSEISGETKENQINNNLILNKIKTKKYGSATMMIYTINAFKYYLKYIEKNKIENSYIYILGLKLGPYLKIYRNKIKKLGITIYLNPDGLEYSREKWNFFVKSFFKYSEKTMIKNSDLIICDSKEIQKYLDNKYKNINTTFIAYGVEDVNISNEEKILKKYNLIKDKYYLIVGRFVPENNYELVLKEFMKSNVDKSLVIVSNIEKNKFYNTLLNATNYDKDKRIIVLGSIYDKVELTAIRKNAFAYIHGHSVGGTNPSLLEAMNTTKLNILYDVKFNKEVGDNTCLYFNNENGNLKTLLEGNLEERKKELNNKARERIKDNYTWNIIINKYKDVFK